MIKKNYGNNLKEQLVAGAKDRLYSFLLADGAVRGALVHGTRMVNEMRANHDLGILETLVLGQAYLGGGLISASLKGHDRIVLQINCSGPIKGLVVEANAFGEVRGYLKNIRIPLDKPLENFNLSPFFGAGFLSVTRHLENSKQPFTGKVALQHGNIAQDLAYYFLVSEQTPTAFHLSIQFNSGGIVTGAGGLFLQAMPGTSEKTAGGAEDLVRDLPSLGSVFSTGKDPEELVQEVFQQYSPKILENYRIEFMCHCNKDRLYALMTMLPANELDDILEKGPFPIELRCHNCNTKYFFSKSEIQQIYRNRFPKN